MDDNRGEEAACIASGVSQMDGIDPDCGHVDLANSSSSSGERGTAADTSSSASSDEGAVAQEQSSQCGNAMQGDGVDAGTSPNGSFQEIPQPAFLPCCSRCRRRRRQFIVVAFALSRDSHVTRSF